MGRECVPQWYVRGSTSDRQQGPQCDHASGKIRVDCTAGYGCLVRWDELFLLYYYKYEFRFVPLHLKGLLNLVTRDVGFSLRHPSNRNGLIMPRVHRFLFPGSLAHIMARGLDGMPIFRDDNDRLCFLRRLKREITKTGYQCFAWALMGNHYHLLLRTNEYPIARVMRPLNGSFGRFFNKKYSRRGYVFQDRYKSVLCQDQSYACELIRYIHLNPIRSGQVKDVRALSSWKWCGHGAMIGRKNALGSDFQHVAEALRRFGKQRQSAVSNYIAFLQEGMREIEKGNHGLDEDALLEHDAAAKGLPAIIGNPSFVREAIEKNRHRMGLIRRFEDKEDFLSALARKVCRKHGIPTEELHIRGRENARSRARREFIGRALTEYHQTPTAVARYLGITLPPVVIARDHWLSERA
ncbi:MAG: hypothetical protein GF418_11110 [Chitinivibrionales bacterium]|nr:hypothetical protein [Chitinivibrionales bacterium]MBD3396164.1 hypothetical protein [Chitinivibrionales bacterium]